MRFSEQTVMAHAEGDLEAPAYSESAAALCSAESHGALADAVPSKLIEIAQQVSPVGNQQPAHSLPAWRLAGVGTLMLASGLLFGRLLGTHPTPAMITLEGRMLATGELAMALARQSSAVESLPSTVVIGLSYLAKHGSYCRTFTLKQSESIAGLACHETDGWHIQALAQTGPKSPLGQYRMAGALVPSLILGAVENTMDGSPLDAATETAARARQWRR
jgi:hypothetical protein